MVRRAGLTVVEILIAIVIIGVLIGLMLPAVQSARESSRRAQSENDQQMAAESTWENLANHPKSDSGVLARHSLIGDAYNVSMQVEDADAEAAESQPAKRRIIYEAQLALVVESVADTEAAIVELLEEFDGYVAESNVAGREGEQLTGRWQVRIPVARFQAFLTAAAKLGIAENRQQTAQDVSEEFVDLEARIANAKRLEARIVELLDTASGKITDVIEVEQQLARVRGEIEQMEGRLRYLANRTDLTTVSITVREEHDYVPPEAPTYTTQVKQTWAGSLETLQEFGQRVGLAIVGAAPWVAILIAVLAPLVWWTRRRARRVSER